MAYLHGKFVWFEHVSDGGQRAHAFYRELFGWRIESVPMGTQCYSMIHAGTQAIGGFRSAQSGTPNHWLSYLSVPYAGASGHESPDAARLACFARCRPAC